VIIGCLGAGQLGRMMAMAALPLNIDMCFYDQSEDAPASQLAYQQTGSFTDRASLSDWAQGLDVITFDWENVPLSTLNVVKEFAPIYPKPSALKVSQDRLFEKTLFTQLNIPTPQFAAIDSYADLLKAIAHFGMPGVLKTRRLGYDGKGQARIQKNADIEKAWQTLKGVPLIYESWVDFDCEVSLIAVRSKRGECAFYPLSRNEHTHGILAISRAPFSHALMERKARLYLNRLLDHLNYVGVLTVEFFIQGNKLIANEMAPRVHNSGHWTIEGAVTSQFENHIRAICGMPLGSTEPRGHSAMINLIGAMPKQRSKILGIAGAHWHDYAKEEARAGRKMGHITLNSETSKAREQKLKQLLKLL
jgi:5-(carboxyamino)imidazole ribonucleotide synthase